MKKKVLITGSCGFVMGNFLRKAIYERAAYNFVSIDRVNSNVINSMYWNKNHIFHVADIRDRHVLDIIFQFEKPDIVIHGASETMDINNFTTSNFVGTQNIIDACVKHNVERLIYTSTDAVYQASTNPIDESSPINPKTLYAATKAAGELLIKAASQTYGLKYNITRAATNYGPRQMSNHLIPSAIKSILNSQNMAIDTKATSDWTHVFDYCSAILTILENGVSNETYNVAANQEFSNIEVLQKICTSMNKPDALSLFADDSEAASESAKLLNTDKTKSIGWKPHYKLKDGIVGTTEWYTNNQWFLK